MITKEQYQDKLEAQLKEWSARIHILKAEAERHDDGKKTEQTRRIMEILDQKVALEERVNELKEASGMKWIELKDSVQKAQANFEASFQTIVLEII